MDQNSIKKELVKRVKVQAEKAAAPKFRIEDYCFPEQIAFIRDPSKFKTAVCSRRAGKTVSCAADLIDTALNHDEGDVAYITLNRRTAKKIIWRELMQINKKYKLGGKPDNTELTLTMPHGPVIHVSGAKDEAEIEKFLGHPLRKVYIDEAQSFRPYLERLVNEILEPTMIDYDGTIILIGTPGPVPVGYFYECAHNSRWANHKWTIHNNPWIQKKSKKTPEQSILDICERRGLPLTHPSIQREYFGRWLYDAEALVYKFNPAINIYDKAPEKLDTIFGIDIGWLDSDAIAVLGYSSADSCVYLLDEFVKNKQTITELVEQIEKMREIYQPNRMVMDAGALGKKIQEEIRSRHTLPLEAAEKTRKHEFIELLNDDLRTGKFKAKKGSRFEQDSYLVQWNWKDPAKPKISDSYHTDVGDAVLYGWRDCKHYFYTPPIPKNAPNTDAYMKELEEREAEAMEMAKNSDNDLTDVQNWADLGIEEDLIDDF